jgi:hypothetical protein
VAVIGVLALVVVVGIAAAGYSFLHKGSTPHPSTSTSTHHHTGQTSKLVELTPLTAQGFDALNPNNDAANENSFEAPNILQHKPAGWSSQQYNTAELGNLKKGTGLIFDMGQNVQLSSVTVQFGPAHAADVQILLGNSNVRSPGNEQSMTPVASADNVGGSYTFSVTSKATGRYLVIWFTKMPPAQGKFMAQVFSIKVMGKDVSG